MTSAAQRLAAALDGRYTMRVTAQLTGASDGLLFWSESYDREVSDVFALQDEITRAIVSALEVRLAAGATPASATAQATDAETYDKYLRGVYLYRRRGAGLLRAEQLFSEVIGRDSTFARGHAMLATVLLTQPYYFPIRVGAGDTSRVDVAATPAAEFAPAISSDGRWIAYASNESGRSEIYVRPFPEVRNTRWQVSTGGGSAPRWNRNGMELFFIRPNGDLVSVPILPGTVFTAGIPSALFSTEPYLADDAAISYDVHPDGNRFLMLRLLGTARPDDLILVENLPEVLAARTRPR